MTTNHTCTTTATTTDGTPPPPCKACKELRRQGWAPDLDALCLDEVERLVNAAELPGMSQSDAWAYLKERRQRSKVQLVDKLAKIGKCILSLVKR